MKPYIVLFLNISIFLNIKALNEPYAYLGTSTNDVIKVTYYFGIVPFILNKNNSKTKLAHTEWLNRY